MPILNENLAYIAGFIDADGCLNIKIQGNTKIPRLTIANNNKAILNFIYEEFSKVLSHCNHIYKVRDRPSHYHLYVHGKRSMRLLLPLLIPYLRLKKDKALKLLKCSNRNERHRGNKFADIH